MLSAPLIAILQLQRTNLHPVSAEVSLIQFSKQPSSPKQKFEVSSVSTNNRMSHLCPRCHPCPPDVILSEAKDLCSTYDDDHETATIRNAGTNGKYTTAEAAAILSFERVLGRARL